MALTHSYPENRPGFLRSLVDGLIGGLSRITEANARVRETERLQAMSDEQLAAKGLKRDDIVRHVFRDLYWL